jgi:predicted nucleic acid-binding protein
MFLLDTCVVSETSKPVSSQAVLRWMTQQDPEELFMSTLTLGELHFGVRLMPPGKRRESFASWLAELERDFAGRFIVFDDASAIRWAALRLEDRNAHTVDCQIAATALAYGLTLVTRNVKDFAYKGLTVFNPWQG